MSGVFFIFLFSDKICLNCTKVRIICTLTYIAHLLRNTPENIITPIIYQTEDGKIKIETHFENETVWLNIDQIAELFQKSRSTINKHILNISPPASLSSSSFMAKPFIKYSLISAVAHFLKCTP
jgi:hypothetical protein